MRRLRRLLLPVLALVLVCTGLPPASAAAPDVWAKWNLGDTWIRSLDRVGGLLVAGSETSGVYTASSAAGPWSDVSGNLSTSAKHVRQAVGQSGQIYLATSAGLFKGSGGGSWSQLGVADSTPQSQRLDMGGIQSVVFPAGSASTIVVSTAGTSPTGVFYSTDSGVKWSRATGLTSATFYLTGNASAMYAAASDGFYKSTDSGKSWTLRSDGIPSGEAGKRIAVSPVNSQQLVAATAGGVYRSDNGGTTWYDASGSGDTALDVSEVRAFQLVPSAYWGGGPPRIVVGTNNGVWASGDGGDTWAKMSGTKANAPGEIAMASESVYSLDIGFAGPSLMAGTQGHGIFSIPLQAAEAPGTVPAPSGSAVRNAVLTANHGVWGGSAPFLYAYQWKRCSTTSVGSCADIAGESGSTYQPVQADVGLYIRVGVRARSLVQPFFSPEAVSNYVGPIAAPAGFEPTPPSNYPQLVNGASVPWGTTMSIDLSDDAQDRWKSNGTYTTTSFAYRWYRCDVNGANCNTQIATTPTYTTTVDDVDHRVTAYVIGTIAGTSSPERLAGVSGSVYEQKPQNLSPPKAIGPAYIGTKLQSTAGAWTGHHPTFTRRWLRCNASGVQCQPLNPSVTTSTYTVRAADQGSTFRVEVTAKVVDSFQARTSTVQSARSAVVRKAPLGAAACQALKGKVAKAKKAVKAAQKALKKAKKTGKAAKIKRAKRKLATAKRKLRAVQAAVKAGSC